MKVCIPLAPVLYTLAALLMVYIVVGVRWAYKQFGAKGLSIPSIAAALALAWVLFGLATYFQVAP